MAKKSAKPVGTHYVKLANGAKSELMSEEAANKAAAEYRAEGETCAVLPADLPDAVKDAAKQFAEDVVAKKSPKAAVKKLEKALAAAPKAAKAKKEPKAAKPKSDKGSSMDALVKLMQRKDGATTKEMAEATGWQNAGWNTIIGTLAERRGLKLKIEKRAAEGSKRQINVFKLAA